MLPKQRILAAIKGEQIDRVPWCPFLAYWWEAQPKEFQAGGQLSFLKEIGADPLLRGSHNLWKETNKACSVRETLKGKTKVLFYETPVGTLTAEYTFVEEANTWFLTTHPVKTENDYKTLTYINENLILTPNIAAFNDEYDKLGNEGLYLPLVGTGSKTAFQSLVEHWVGTEELVYALADYPKTVEACLAAMTKKSIETAGIAVESKAEAFIFWEDSSTTNISPELFKKYTAPEINSWGKIIHSSGKYLIHHACGHLKGLLPEMRNTEIDMIESISPPPTGNIELWEAKKLLPENIGLIGGIEPTVFLNSTMAQLEEHVRKLLANMGKDKFILANSDSCPPGVTIDKFKLVTKLNQECKF